MGKKTYGYISSKNNCLDAENELIPAVCLDLNEKLKKKKKLVKQPKRVIKLFKISSN